MPRYDEDWMEDHREQPEDRDGISAKPHRDRPDLAGNRSLKLPPLRIHAAKRLLLDFIGRIAEQHGHDTLPSVRVPEEPIA